jgi:hypothetical protein
MRALEKNASSNEETSLLYTKEMRQNCSCTPIKDCVLEFGNDALRRQDRNQSLVLGADALMAEIMRRVPHLAFDDFVAGVPQPRKLLLRRHTTKAQEALPPKTADILVL